MYKVNTMEEKKEVYGVIYKVTNLMNHKVYIGQTTQDFKKYKSKHIYCSRDNQIKNKNRAFYKALREYGPHKFKWEVLGECKGQEDLDITEIRCIDFYKSTMEVYGYNMVIGGRGVVGLDQSEEEKDKLRDQIYEYYERGELHLFYKMYSSLEKGKHSKEKNAAYIQVDDNKIIELYKKGYTQYRIAEELEVSRAIIHSRLKWANVLVHNHLYVDKELLLQYHKEGKTLREVSRITGIYYGLLRRRCKTWGIKFENGTGEDHYQYISLDINKVISLKQENKTNKEICALLGVSLSLLRNRIREHKLKLKVNQGGKNNPQYKHVDLDTILQLREQGLSYKKIGKIVGISEPAVTKRCKNPDKFR